MTHAEGGRGRSRRRRGGLPLKVLLALALLSLTAGCAGTGHPDPRKMTFPERVSFFPRFPDHAGNRSNRKIISNRPR